jgi:hypothetical protein
MTITRQDLEDAAKAAGLQEHGWMGDTYCHVVDNTWATFDPAANPADAFDLAMKCGMYIDFFGGFVGASTGEERRFTPHNHAECAAAIVLAAAEMERSKK